MKQGISVDPACVIATWPTDRPLVVLSSSAPDRKYGRWTIIAEPTGRLWHDRGRTHASGSAADLGLQLQHDALADLNLLSSHQSSGDSSELPFQSGWIGYLSYQLGALIEPRAGGQRVASNSCWPMWEWLHCPTALVYDHERSEWYRTDARGRAQKARLQECRSQRSSPSRAWIEQWRATQSRASVIDAIERTLGYIAAGDIYQANISQEWLSRLHGSPRALFVRALQSAPARYGGYLELDDRSEPRTVFSLSPELFLRFDCATRIIETRPIKGTAPHFVARGDLEASAKDRAELAMIVDLMRNDLARVCEAPSITVEPQRAIETHSSVHHGVGTVRGVLRTDATLSDIVAATFPPGSITGAPKIRAMQIIDELEVGERDVYCGCVGMICHSGRVQMNVAIRTMLIENDRVRYRAGAGIVADSHPESEYEEMLAKRASVDTLLADPDLPSCAD